MSLHRQAFTLIELLIVVAIIGILAAIAVPNFLNAMVKAQVSRAMTDMKTIGDAAEMYALDQGRIPIGYSEGTALGLWDSNHRGNCYNRFTTPVAYLSSIPFDPFAEKKYGGYRPGEAEQTNTYKYYWWGTMYGANGNLQLLQQGYTYMQRCIGPSLVERPPYGHTILLNNSFDNVYHPTNGVKSVGWIFRTNKGFFGRNN
jgi:type II secretion system protein G